MCCECACHFFAFFKAFISFLYTYFLELVYHLVWRKENVGEGSGSDNTVLNPATLYGSKSRSAALLMFAFDLYRLSLQCAYKMYNQPELYPAKLGHLNPAKTRAFRRRNKHEFTLQLTLSMVRIRWFEPRSCSMNL